MIERRRSRPALRPRRAGLTLIEVMIAMGILTIVIGIAFLLLAKSTDVYENQSVHLSLDTQMRELLKQMSEELRMGRGVVLFGNLPLTDVDGAALGAEYTAVQFRYPGFFAQDTADPNKEFKAIAGGGDLLFNRRVKYEVLAHPMDPAGGGDQNLDGRVDEQIIRKTVDTLDDASGAVLSTAVSTVCSDVKPAGGGEFFVKFIKRSGTPNTVEISITLQKIDPKNRKNLIERTQTTRVQLRN